MGTFVKRKYALLAIVLFAWLGTSSSQQKPGAVVIINAQIADGTGKPLRKGSVRISGDRITQVGLRPRKGSVHRAETLLALTTAIITRRMR